MFVDILEYMKLDRSARRSHLKLDEDCIEIGGSSPDFRGILAYFLKTKIPSSGKIALLCHGCHNGKCSNVNHLYWGTYSDNLKDAHEGGSRKPYWEYAIDKYGLEAANAMRKSRAKNGGIKGGTAGKGKVRLTDEEISHYVNVIGKYDQSKRGWVGQAAKELNISHTHVRRILNKFVNKEAAVM